MATAPKAPTAGQADTAPAKSNKMIFILLGVVLLLLIAGGAGAWFLLSSKGQNNSASAAQAAPSKPPVFMVLEPFTVNLHADEGVQQFLQIGMTLQVADQAQTDLIKLYLPQVRGGLLMLLSSKRASEILTTDGKQKLSEEVVAQLKESFSGKSQKPDVSGVFFTSFVVQ